MKETGSGTEVCKASYIPQKDIRLPATSLPPLMQKIPRIGSLCFTQQCFRNMGPLFLPFK